MHEWALAEAILTSANAIILTENLKEVTVITIKLGELQQIDPAILRLALSEMKPPIFKAAKFRILKAKTTLECRVCGNTWLFNSKNFDKEKAEAIHFVPEVAHTYVKCQRCGSCDFKVVSGRGVWIENIKGIK